MACYFRKYTKTVKDITQKFLSIFELIIFVAGRKRCTRNIIKRSEEDTGLSEYDKNGLSDNGMLYCIIIYPRLVACHFRKYTRTVKDIT